MKKTQDVSTLDEDLLQLFQNTPQLTKEKFERLEQAGKALEQDPEFQADLMKSRFINAILDAMEEQGLSQSELARRWGKSRQYVNKLFNEDKRVNFTIESMTELALLVGKKLDLMLLAPDVVSHVLRCKVPKRTVERIPFDFFGKKSNEGVTNICFAEFNEPFCLPQKLDYGTCLSA